LATPPGFVCGAGCVPPRGRLSGTMPNSLLLAARLHDDSMSQCIEERWPHDLMLSGLNMD
jgi:hypothetical protein